MLEKIQMKLGYVIWDSNLLLIGEKHFRKFMIWLIFFLWIFLFLWYWFREERSEILTSYE